MGGRSGSASNRDVLISLLTAIGTILSFGFLVNTVIHLLSLRYEITHLIVAPAHQ